MASVVCLPGVNFAVGVVVNSAGEVDSYVLPQPWEEIATALRYIPSWLLVAAMALVFISWVRLGFRCRARSQVVIYSVRGRIYGNTVADRAGRLPGARSTNCSAQAHGPTESGSKSFSPRV